MTLEQFIERLRQLPPDSIWVEAVRDSGFGKEGGPDVSVEAKLRGGLNAVVFIRESLVAPTATEVSDAVISIAPTVYTMCGDRVASVGPGGMAYINPDSDTATS